MTDEQRKAFFAKLAKDLKSGKLRSRTRTTKPNPKLERYTTESGIKLLTDTETFVSEKHPGRGNVRLLVRAKDYTKSRAAHIPGHHPRQKKIDAAKKIVDDAVKQRRRLEPRFTKQRKLFFHKRSSGTNVTRMVAGRTKVPLERVLPKDAFDEFGFVDLNHPAYKRLVKATSRGPGKVVKFKHKRKKKNGK
jgi:hypothetical protein